MTLDALEAVRALRPASFSGVWRMLGRRARAVERTAREAPLEVRLSTMPARRLYEKYGFRPVGIRPRYYSDNGEDALIMTTDALAAPSMRERLARLRAALEA